MRIRELTFHNFRSFRGERRISFVDPLTDTVRPVTVLAGSNGCGKTTVLEAIEALLAYKLLPSASYDLIQEIHENGAAKLIMELSPTDLPLLSDRKIKEIESSPQQNNDPRQLPIDLPSLSDRELKEIELNSEQNNGIQQLIIKIDKKTPISPLSKIEPFVLDELSDQEHRVLELISKGYTNKDIADALSLGEGTARNYVSSVFSKLGVSNRTEAATYFLRQKWHAPQQKGGLISSDQTGGVLYFPYDRYLELTEGGAIEPPIEQQPWLFHFSPTDRWQHSLEQLWVWQNYLDLEAGNQNRQNLAPFVKSVEDVLGEDRRITISKGRVRVPVEWKHEGERPTVRLDQLPSGEQQVLLLFGELARRRRQGCVIMIDEIENSLHPTLQRLVMWNLERIAREWDAQIIVTTHSWEVINWVRGSAFINLDYPEDHFDQPVPKIPAEAPGL